MFYVIACLNEVHKSTDRYFIISFGVITVIWSFSYNRPFEGNHNADAALFKRYTLSFKSSASTYHWKLIDIILCVLPTISSTIFYCVAWLELICVSQILQVFMIRATKSCRLSSSLLTRPFYITPPSQRKCTYEITFMAFGETRVCNGWQMPCEQIWHSSSSTF